MKTILVTGSTGYVGGRLVPRLLGPERAVRVLVRDPGRVVGRPWAAGVQIARADLRTGEGLKAALLGVHTAYYLVHSMSGGGDFSRLDREAARRFGAAARDAGVKHVIYLGGLMPKAAASKHLASRAEVGAILAAAVPTTELRAGPIVGSGSASFEMVRYLTERLPLMLAPGWIDHEVQPIAIRDILSYLTLALDLPPLGIVDIGADRLTFRRMVETYAELRGLRRVICTVPAFMPQLAARWIGALTPIPNALAVPLVQGMVQSLVADTRRAREIFPGIAPLDYRTAVSLALVRVEKGEVETRWSGALGHGPTAELEDSEGLARETRSRLVDAPPEAVFRAFSGVGGDRGWPAWEWAWILRGALDRLAGGPGLRRGRRHPDEIFPGEALDFWRVEAAEPPRLLRLRAEMRLPGRAWLQWEAFPEEGGTRLVQTALFAPNGLLGTAYWYGLYPFHQFIFSAMVDALARRAEAGQK
ncbi:MAG: SDR family oxidoreductase [Elusimicrobia bacterium]|nr:SDR family oxidoreductase [Elusimicrobiota bacterium]